jgi:hypothetical protein
VDPIRPIINTSETIPPVIPLGRVDPVKRRQRDAREDFEEHDAEPESEDESPDDDEHPHVDISA